LIDYSAYMLPIAGSLADRIVDAVRRNGTLLRHVLGSLGRLFLGFLIGNAIAIPLGSQSPSIVPVADMLRPLLTSCSRLRASPGTARDHSGSASHGAAVLFVIANTIFFSSLYNTSRRRGDSNTRYRAVRSHGGQGIQILTELVLPGALVGRFILGCAPPWPIGWRALVAGR